MNFASITDSFTASVGSVASRARRLATNFQLQTAAAVGLVAAMGAIAPTTTHAQDTKHLSGLPANVGLSNSGGVEQAPYNFVTRKPFLIDAREVTSEQFKTLMRVMARNKLLPVLVSGETGEHLELADRTIAGMSHGRNRNVRLVRTKDSNIGGAANSGIYIVPPDNEVIGILTPYGYSVEASVELEDEILRVLDQHGMSMTQTAANNQGYTADR